MPWPPKQRAAIFLDLKRRRGKTEARRFMHAHGYGGKGKRKDHGGEVDALVRRLRHG